MQRITDTVKTLLIANVLVFLGSQLIGSQATEYFALWFPKNDHFRFWQVLTHMFMHASIAHIFFNMFALWMFGSILEQTIGQKRFLFLYFSAGLAAAALQLSFTYLNYHSGFQDLLNAGWSPDEIKDMMDNALRTGHFRVPEDTVDSVRSMIRAYGTPMVGASGAIFGIVAAFAVVYPNLPLYLFFIPIPIKAKYLVGGYFVIELFSGFTGTGILGSHNVAHWAHVGGAVLGFLVMWYWKKNQFNRNRWN